VKHFFHYLAAWGKGKVRAKNGRRGKGRGEKEMLGHKPEDQFTHEKGS